MDKTNEFTVNESQIRQIWPKVYRFIYYRVQNREEAEDLTQETMRRVFPKLKSGELPAEKVESYIFTAARNLINEEWWKRTRRPVEVSADELKKSGWDPPSIEASSREEGLIVKQALDYLKDDHREVLTLRIIEGYSVLETSEIMKRKPGAVRALQLRAGQALKRQLEKRGFFDE